MTLFSCLRSRSDTLTHIPNPESLKFENVVGRFFEVDLNHHFIYPPPYGFFSVQFCRLEGRASLLLLLKTSCLFIPNGCN